MGNESARNVLEAGWPVHREIARWRTEHKSFHAARARALIY